MGTPRFIYNIQIAHFAEFWEELKQKYPILKEKATTYFLDIQERRIKLTDNSVGFIYEIYSKPTLSNDIKVKVMDWLSPHQMVSIETD